MTISIIKNHYLLPLKVEGRDRERYLQGRITQDVKNLLADESRQALILSPQGRVEGKFSLSKLEDGFLLFVEVAESFGIESFLSGLLRFKVADDVVVTDLSLGFNVYTLFSWQDIDPDFLRDIQAKGFVLRSVKRGSLNCVDILVSKDVLEEDLLKSLGLDLGVSEYGLYDLERIKAGYPLTGRDILETTVAPDLDLSSYVSFKKGCYAGQEVIEMSIARGRPNRALVKIEVDGNLLEGVDLKFYDQSFENNLGFITSVCYDRGVDRTFGLGFIKIKHEPVEIGYLKDCLMPLNIYKLN